MSPSGVDAETVLRGREIRLRPAPREYWELRRATQGYAGLRGSRSRRAISVAAQGLDRAFNPKSTIEGLLRLRRGRARTA